jgi:hypothetical protein
MIDLHYWTTPNGHKITMFLEETGSANSILICAPGRIGPILVSPLGENRMRTVSVATILNYAQAHQQPQGLNGEASTYFHANGWFHDDAIQRRGRKAHHRPVPPVKSISDWTSKRSST